MDNIDKLQSNIENMSHLLTALIPFVSSPMQTKLRAVSKSLEPIRHLKEMIQMMEMVQTLQAAMQSTPDGTPDFSALSGFLNSEQMQMLEMFQMMQSMQDISE